MVNVHTFHIPHFIQLSNILHCFHFLRLHLHQEIFVSDMLPYYICSNEVRSVFNLWATLLSETRKLSRLKADFAQVLASEMTSRITIMINDVQFLTRKVIIQIYAVGLVLYTLALIDLVTYLNFVYPCSLLLSMYM